MTTLEALLCTAYEQEAACYARALQIAENAGPALRNGQAAEAEMSGLVACLHDVDTIETGIKGHKEAWQKSARDAGPELRALLARVAELIQSLQDRLAAAEQAARAHIGRLGPQLDEMIRSRRMRQAYGGIMARR